MSRQALLLSALGVVVVALFWLFVYSPGADEVERIEGEIAAAQEEGAGLQLRIAELEAIRADAPEIETLIANLRGIVPVSPDTAAAIRQLSAAAADAGVEIDTFAPTRPQPSGAPESDLHRIGVSANVTGSYFQIVDFLRRLEDPRITARGFTVSNIAMDSAEYPSLTVSLTGSMFAELEPVPDPQAPAPAPAPAPDAADGSDAEEES